MYFSFLLADMVTVTGEGERAEEESVAKLEAVAIEDSGKLMSFYRLRYFYVVPGILNFLLADMKADSEDGNGSSDSGTFHNFAS